MRIKHLIAFVAAFAVSFAYATYPGGGTGTGLPVYQTAPTLLAPVISSIANTGTLTLPTSTDTLIGKATIDTLTNKTFDTAGTGNIFKINGTSVTSKTGTGAAVLATSPTISSATLTAPIISSIVNTGTLTLPTSTDTLIGKATTDTLTNKTFDTAGTGNSFLINGTTITAKTGTGSVVLASSPTITTPSITSPTITTGVTYNGTSSGTTLVQASATASGTLTLPAATDTLVGKATTDTLTNKTLTAPVISTITNTGTLTLPSSTDTLIGKATTDTLTNKTFDTAGAGNVFKINGTQITANTGTGSNVLANSPTLITPNIGAATGASVALTGLSTINLNAATLPTAIAGSVLQTASSDGTGGTISIDTTGAGASFIGRRANTSLASPSGLVAGNAIASLNAQGYGATGYITGSVGRVLLSADGTWSDTSAPTKLTVVLAPANSITGNTVFTIDSIGNALLNSSGTPVANLRYGADNSLASWTTSGAGLRAAAATYTNTSTAGSGTAATGHINTFAQPTIAATNSSVTVTDAATVYIANAPANGTNVTITTPYALEVAAGSTKLQTITATGFNTDASNHVQVGGNTPTVSTCGTSPSVSGNDARGDITVGSGVTTACTITFGSAYSSTPVCVGSDNSGTISTGVTSVSTTAVTFGFSASLASGHVYYICFR